MSRLRAALRRLEDEPLADALSLVCLIFLAVFGFVFAGVLQ